MTQQKDELPKFDVFALPQVLVKLPKFVTDPEWLAQHPYGSPCAHLGFMAHPAQWDAMKVPEDHRLDSDGRKLSKADYPDLYEVFKCGGETALYGEDDETFNLPDVRGRIIVGKEPDGTQTGR